MIGAGPDAADVHSSEEIVAAWYAAFNDRDLDGILARFDPAIELNPLRFPGIAQTYRGHDGVRRWFEAVTSTRPLHRIDIETISPIDHGRVLAAGSVSMAGVAGITPFSGLHSLAGGLIVEVSHYFTPSTVLDRLGMIEPEDG